MIKTEPNYAMSVTLHAVGEEVTNERWIGKSAHAGLAMASSTDDYPKRVFAAMELYGRRVEFQLDCGASSNVLRMCDLPPAARLQITSKILKVCDGATLNPGHAGASLVKCSIQRTGVHIERSL